MTDLAQQIKALAEERALDIERDIRIALWNTGCWQGKPQEVAQSFIRHAMEEPTTKRAMANIATALSEAERMREALACEELAILHGQQVSITFKNTDEAFALFNELKARAALGGE